MGEGWLVTNVMVGGGGRGRACVLIVIFDAGFQAGTYVCMINAIARCTTLEGGREKFQNW